MDIKYHTRNESKDMSTANINQFIETTRQHLFGLFPVDVQHTSTSKAA